MYNTDGVVLVESVKVGADCQQSAISFRHREDWGAAGHCPQHSPFRRNEMHIPMEGDETNVQLIQFNYATERA
jgi:hypothetical protein